MEVTLEDIVRVESEFQANVDDAAKILADGERALAGGAASESMLTAEALLFEQEVEKIRVPSPAKPAADNRKKAAPEEDINTPMDKENEYELL